MSAGAPRKAPLRIGLISDTHDLLRPEALAFLAGSDRIVHAGDICSPGVLEALAAVAPLTAVRGNNDRGAWAARLRESELVDVGGDGVDVVVSGHSHRPLVERRDGVLFINPGSAGPRRFSLPISVGELTIVDGAASARTVTL